MYKETVKSRSVAWLAALMAILMIACSDTQQVEQELPLGTPVTAHFRLATANSGVTTRAEAEENMKSWVVIITNQADGAVENVFTKENLENAESDFVTRQVTTGTKRIYSFANITLEELIDAIGSIEPIADDPIETIKSINNISEAISSATFLPQGNNWADAENKGIPMSNWQDMEIKSDGKTYTLYVCRMIAKVEFQLKNLTNSDIKVKSVTISDITSNDTPVKLMPGTSVTAENTKQSEPDIEVVPVEVTASLGDAVALSAGQTTSVTVYVNESQVQSDYGLFRLTLTIDRGTGEEEELRYALLSDESSNWTWIARNDHRIIPINIDDYKLDIVPVDFPPIGVYPASVKEDEEGTFTCTFYAGGEFYLTPVVTRYSTGIPLTKDVFKAWNGVGANAQVAGEAVGEIHIGENLGAGAMVYGTSTVDPLAYADLSTYSKMIIEGTPGVQLRVLMNRALGGEAPNFNGALTEVNATIGEDGTVEVSFAGMEFVHLNAIKTAWSSQTGTITKISLAKSDATWDITSFTTPETTPAGEANTLGIYATPLSWNGKDLVLTGAFNNGVTGEAYHELTVTVDKGNGVTQTLLGRIWVKLAGGSN